MTEPISKLCFLIGPIGNEDSEARIHSDKLRKFIIEPAMQHLPEFKIVRADDIAEPGMIDGHIIKRLNSAELVIADLATLNPNVFYEIGVRHVLAKPIIHIQDESENIPFDVMLYSAVLYSLNSVKSMEAAVSRLKQHVDAALDPSHEVDNPVTRVLHRAGPYKSRRINANDIAPLLPEALKIAGVQPPGQASTG